MAAPLQYRDEAADDRMAGTPSALRYLPQLLTYPLTGFCLPVMTLVALFIFIGAQSMGGIPMLAITGTWMLHYVMAIIEHTARGHATAPPLAGEVVFLDAWKTFKALVGPLVLYTAYGALMHTGRPAAAAVLLALGAFLTPAYLLTLALSGDLASALNPLHWLRFVAGLGLTYLLPCAMLALGALAVLHVASDLSLGVLAFAICYLLCATAHLLGFVAYHRHQVLGLDVHVGDPEDKRRAREQQQRFDALIATLEARLRERDLEGAARALHAEPGGPANLRGFHEDAFERIGKLGAWQLLHEQGRRLIGVLLDERRDHRAFEVFETCENRHPRFEPATPEHWLRLCAQAQAEHLDERFEKMVDALALAHPGSDAAVSAALLRARACSERGDDARARELLQPLLAHGAHPQAAQIRALARALAKLDSR